MKLTEAKLCNNCDEVFSGMTCPACGGDGWFVSAWIPPVAMKKGVQFRFSEDCGQEPLEKVGVVELCRA